ncbi:MAG: hypothetical protein JNK25_13750 [Phycisphaerae bacterium]|nr:hypothetical protein [Phycisphaerae bacterium]
MSRTRSTLISVLLFAALLWPSWWAYLYALRETFHGLEAVGIISRGPNLWGQILGRNIPSHGPLIGSAARFIAALAGYGPACCAAFWLFARARRGGDPAAFVPVSVRSFAAGVGMYALLLSLGADWLAGLLREAIMSLGIRAGCEYTSVGVIVFGRIGPFTAGPFAGVFNWLWRNGGWNGAMLAVFVPALALFAFTARRSLRPLPGRCQRCGYDLTGVHGTCPECGTDH